MCVVVVVCSVMQLQCVWYVQNVCEAVWLCAYMQCAVCADTDCVAVCEAVWSCADAVCVAADLLLSPIGVASLRSPAGACTASKKGRMPACPRCSVQAVWQCVRVVWQCVKQCACPRLSFTRPAPLSAATAIKGPS